MNVTCFLIKAVGVDRLSLRRYSTSNNPTVCGGAGYHNAHVFLKDEPASFEASTGYAGEPPKADARWPRACRCGYTFMDTDAYQIFRRALYARLEDSKEVFTLDEAPPGAMWNADWMPSGHHGPDGLCLVLKLPGDHEWMIDGPSKDGGHWTRTGTAPKLTASPSILVPGAPGQPCLYHGWLRDGVLVSC